MVSVQRFSPFKPKVNKPFCDWDEIQKKVANNNTKKGKVKRYEERFQFITLLLLPIQDGARAKSRSFWIANVKLYI